MKLFERGSYSLHNGVIIFSIVACCALFTTYGLQTWHARSIAIRQSTREASNLSRSLSLQVAGAFQIADAVLLDMQETVEAGGLTRTELRRRLNTLQFARVDGFPMVYALTVLNENGRPTNSTQTAHRTENFRDREYFRFHLTHAARSIHIGPPVRSKVDGSWILTATRRINHPDGSFGGLVETKMSLAFFQHIDAGIDVGKQGLITLARDDGVVLVRKPAVESLLGRSIANGTLYKTFERSGPGTFTVRSVLDGINRLSAVRRVPNYPLITIVAFSETEVLAEWHNAAVLNLLLISCVAAMVAFAGNFLASQIRQRQSAQERLSELASLDGLTGLANRREFDSALERAWRRGLRDGTPLGLLMIDADNFKTYNDRYGHVRGDEALVGIAKSIAFCLRRTGDIGARYGGEEFAVVLPATDALGARVIAERIRSCIEACQPSDSDAAHARVTVSIGLASMCPRAVGFQNELLEAADNALYTAKRGGRNCVQGQSEDGTSERGDSGTTFTTKKSGPGELARRIVT